MSVAASSIDHYLQAAAAEDRQFDKEMVVVAAVVGCRAAAVGCRVVAVGCKAAAVGDNRL